MMLPDHDHRLLLPTPFHARTMAANQRFAWHDWNGYVVADMFEEVELEYFAIRNATSVFDLSPMSKYRISGTDATAYLDRLLTRDVSQQDVGRVMYCCWCNDSGQVLDDGTLFRLSEADYQLCAQERHLDWLRWSAIGFDVDIVDETDHVAALAVQGPTSCATLQAMGLRDLAQLKPFRANTFNVDGFDLLVSRTGFTGDLGYELWCDPAFAEQLWDQLFDAGALYGIRPIGTLALDVARIEAGFIQAGVDFLPAEQVVRPGRSRSPFELGLGWLVNLDKPVFNGRAALLAEQHRGSRFQLVKLDVAGNKAASDALIYHGHKRGRRNKEVGYVTSACWSPSSKRSIALASLEVGRPAETLYAEIFSTTEQRWHRRLAHCTIVDNPFFHPERRRATPAGELYLGSV